MGRRDVAPVGEKRKSWAKQRAGGDRYSLMAQPLGYQAKHGGGGDGDGELRAVRPVRRAVDEKTKKRKAKAKKIVKYALGLH